jgi:hypothetical protein
MASIEENLQELEYVKQAFKDNFDNYGVSTSGVEFRNMPNLLVQMEKILPSQVKEITPTTERQVANPDKGFKLTGVVVNAVTSAIDENIQPENIKSGTTILGVTGTLEEGAGGEVQGYDVQSVLNDDGTQTLKITSGYISEEPNLIEKEATENGLYLASDDGVDGYSSFNVNVPSLEGNVIEISTDGEMTNALTEVNLGKVYKFTGTSSTYETDAIYIISEV